MARIISKLNLNKTPQLVESNSIIFAKNIKLLKDGSIGQDDSIAKIDHVLPSLNIDNLSAYKIVGWIPYNTKFYLFLYNNPNSLILEYNELTNTYRKCDCSWSYSGGIIDGTCVVNLNGDILLNICEYKDDNTLLVPIKTINLSEAKNDDDESIYTQTPHIPFYNLSFLEYYNNNIPTGTYQFFIRYEIRENFYTHWFPASKEIFAGTRKIASTNQGPLQYIDTTIDSGSSFHFIVDKISEDFASNYKTFQVGFLLANDDTIVARSWKHFALDTTDIYFDYDQEYIEEIDTTDLLNVPYNLFNVKNITTFKNKLYVSNYIESNFNPDKEAIGNENLKSFIEGIHINLNNKVTDGGQSSYYGYRIASIVKNVNETYITKIDNRTIKNIVEELITDSETYIGTQGRDYTDQLKGIRMDISMDPIDLPYSEPGDTYHMGPYDPTDPPTSGFTNNFSDLIDYIANQFAGFGANGNFYSALANYNSNIVGEICIQRLEYNFNNVMCYDFHITFSVSLNQLVLYSEQIYENAYTLMPGQQYDFYVHLVKNTGEYTNGYKIGNVFVDLITNKTAIGSHKIFYPSFTFDYVLPEEYNACFISMVHTKYNTSEVFNVRTVDEGTYGDNLDLDLTLYKDYDKLNILNVTDETETEGNYYASYDSSYFVTFGSKGKVKVDANDAGDTLFIRMKYDGNEKYSQLTRITPYIIPTIAEGETDYTYDNYKDLNLVSYICNVRVLYDNFKRYVAGDQVYVKGTSQDTGMLTVDNLTKEEYEAWLNQDSSEAPNTDSFIIYSNYNLNYISLREDEKLNPKIISKTFSVEGEGEDDETTTVRGLSIQYESMTLSEVYELVSMYKDYTRKLYQPYTNKSIIKFDNTVRSSIPVGDESKINLFKFNAVDYYNVPTDKGIIINMKAVGEAILVHTEDSMYKFTGSNSLTANGGEDVAMKEGEPFDTGIQEIFGSEFGFAGLRKKSHHTITENGYTFYDADANVFYLYGGQDQTIPLSDSIEKLINRNSISEVKFANDYYNDRIFIYIKFTDNKCVTLSFNFRVKSFISLHDFIYDDSFHTKTKCYLFDKTQNKIYTIKHNSARSYSDLAINNDTLYPSKQSFNIIDGEIINMTGKEQSSIIDIIFKEDYASVKTLNSINWICNKIAGFNATGDNFKYVAEEDLTPYPAGFIRIYTDASSTDLIEIFKSTNPYALGTTGSGTPIQLDEVEEGLRSPINPRPYVNLASYKYARYNLGKWTFNYFRNILNTIDITNSQSASDNKSLIYGKYIVVRFIFSSNDNFKLEDIEFNIAPFN